MPTYSIFTQVFKDWEEGANPVTPEVDALPATSGALEAYGATFVLGTGYPYLIGGVSLTMPEVDEIAAASGALSAYGATFLLAGPADPPSPAPPVPPPSLAPNPIFRYPSDTRCPNCWDEIVWQREKEFRTVNFWPMTKIPLFACWRADGEPWREIPKYGQEFSVRGFIDTPVPATGNVLVLQYVPPPGYTSVLWGFGHGIIGATGYVPGDGEIQWRIFSRGRYVRNFSAMTVQHGNVGSPQQMQDFLFIGNGNDKTGLQYQVELPSGSGVTGGRVWAMVYGWEFPNNYWK